MSNAPDALRALQTAQKNRQEQARKEALESPAAKTDDSLDAEEGLVQLAVYAYADGITFTLGALPDGTGVYGRVRVPGKSDHACAGMVAFLVSDSPVQVVRKALAALESAPTAKFWKPDQYMQK